MKNVVTLKDIAQQLNVSANTVSRAINDKTGVSDEMRATIKSVSAAMGYQPNASARALRGDSMKIIGVIVDDNSNPFIAEILKYIEQEFSHRGYHILLFNSRQNPKIEVESMQFLSRIQANGVIIHPYGIAKELRHAMLDVPFPVVLFGMKSNDLPRIDCVRNDNVGGAKLLMEHLLTQGYRNIAFLNMPRHIPASHERWQGVELALTQAQDNSVVVTQYFADEVGDVAQWAQAIATDRSNRPDCIFCGSDLYATWVMPALLDANVSIPEDIGLCGYDDMAFSKMLRVPLTTVSQPKQLIAKTCAELLYARFENPHQKNSVEHVLAPQLMVRQSTTRVK